MPQIGSTYPGLEPPPAELTQYGLGDWISRYVPNIYRDSKGKVISQKYTPQIQWALHGDGGSHSEIYYLRVKNKPMYPSLDGLEAVSDHHYAGQNRPAHSMIQAYVGPQ